MNEDEEFIDLFATKVPRCNEGFA